MSDETRGLYQKYRVERIDGSSAPGGKHDGCEYFVLDLTHDPHALPAIEAYAESCKKDYPNLHWDLKVWAGSQRRMNELKAASEVASRAGKEVGT